ncbi:hypothetical protein QFZ54_000015 [Sphingomonas faeni]|nr:hypothetical protein [Sphingomonas faeni]
MAAHPSSRTRALSALALIAGMAASPVTAQSTVPSPNAPEASLTDDVGEITVTARRRVFRRLWHRPLHTRSAAGVRCRKFVAVLRGTTSANPDRAILESAMFHDPHSVVQRPQSVSQLQSFIHAGNRRPNFGDGLRTRPVSQGGGYGYRRLGIWTGRAGSRSAAAQTSKPPTVPSATKALWTDVAARAHRQRRGLGRAPVRP